MENVLRFSTLGRDRLATADPIDPAEAIKEIIGEFQPLAAARGALITLDVVRARPTAIWPDALRHMIVNLLDNAVKYGPRDQTIRVSVTSDDESLAIAVEDDGPGIPARERDAIWRPFTRGRAAASRGGSGIGLSIVRELARAHGGSARVEAADGRSGARFVVTLPITRQATPEWR